MLKGVANKMSICTSDLDFWLENWEEPATWIRDITGSL